MDWIAPEKVTNLLAYHENGPDPLTKYPAPFKVNNYEFPTDLMENRLLRDTPKHKLDLKGSPLLLGCQKQHVGPRHAGRWTRVLSIPFPRSLPPPPPPDSREHAEDWHARGSMKVPGNPPPPRQPNMLLAGSFVGSGGLPRLKGTKSTGGVGCQFAAPNKKEATNHSQG